MGEAGGMKANFAVENKYEAFFTGGTVQFSEDGEKLFCQCGTKVQVLEVQTGKVKSSIGQEDDDDVTCFCLSPDDQMLIVAGRSLILRQWNWTQEELTRSWKAIHTGPVASMGFDSTSTLLATGGADSTIKVWDVIQQYCTHNLRGHQGIVSVVKFHPDTSKLQLFSAGEDYKIRAWDLTKSVCIAVLDSHYSYITCLEFNCDSSILYSGGRDQVITVWDTLEYKKQKTIPVYEAVEGLMLLPNSNNKALNVVSEKQHFITAGSKGFLRVWNATTAQCVYSQRPDEPGSESSKKEESDQIIVRLLANKTLSTITTVTHDHNITLYNKNDLSLKKQFAGYNDDILDIQYAGPKDDYIAVATNSQFIKLYTVDSWACQILQGHTDIVMSLDVYKKGSMIVSGSKDNNVRLWTLNSESERTRCVAVGLGHTHAVGAVALSRMSSSFVVSGSQDQTIKIWTTPPEFEDNEIVHMHARATELAHEKDINSVAVSPNDKLIASGSQDKTAKLWNVSDLSLVGVFRGHKRGVWCVQFSTVDQCLATASADTTIKLWALSDFSCVKTFEGHESSVLRVNFISRGMQLVSSGSDGLMKLWTIKTNECMKTFDAHDDKVWALAVNKSQTNVVTGAGDSNIILWKDVTEEELEEDRAKQQEFILQEQELLNLIHEKKFLKAIGLAITLEQPFRVLSILKEVMGSGHEAQEELGKTLRKLRDDQIDSILRFASKWNTNSKHCHAAQLVLSVILKNYAPEDLVKFPNIKSSLEGLLPYTERHFQRMNRLHQQSTFVDYTWQCMRLVGNENVTLEVPMQTHDGDRAAFSVDRKGSRHEDESIDADSASSDDDSSDEDEDDIEEKTSSNGVKLTTNNGGSSSLEESSSESDNSKAEKDLEDMVLGLSGDDESLNDSDLDSEDIAFDSDQENIAASPLRKTKLLLKTSKVTDQSLEKFTPKKKVITPQKSPRTDPIKRLKTKSPSASSKAKRRKSAVR